MIIFIQILFFYLNIKIRKQYFMKIIEKKNFDFHISFIFKLYNFNVNY